MVGTKQLELRTRDGTSIPIGTMTFTPRPDATGFVVAVAVDRAKFKDYFLSMREFKLQALIQKIRFMPKNAKTL